MIEVYLKENNDNILRFPITPSEVGAEGSSEISIEKINGLGEVSIFGGKNLRTATLRIHLLYLLTLPRYLPKYP